MLYGVILLVPVVGAILGGLIHWVAAKMFLNALVKRQGTIARQAGKMISKDLVSFKSIEDKIVSPENMQKIIPVVETHIDEFLRTKLSKAFPMISMFIGEKTISQLKEVFMKELEEIFPVVLKGYMSNLEKDLNLEQLVSDKMAAIPAEQWKATLNQSIGKELNKRPILGAIQGFLVALVIVLMIYVKY